MNYERPNANARLKM